MVLCRKTESRLQFSTILATVSLAWGLVLSPPVAAQDPSTSLTFESPSPAFMDIVVPAFDGMPRVGDQDTQIRLRLANGASSLELNERQHHRDFNLAAFIYLHRIRFLQDHLRALDPEQPTTYGRTGAGGGRGLARGRGTAPQAEEDPQSRIYLQDADLHLRRFLANVGTDATYRDYFCSEQCTPRPALRFARAPVWGGGNEFDQRAAYQRAVEAEVDVLIDWAESLPESFAAVSFVQLREYDFDAGGFWIYARPSAVVAPNAALVQGDRNTPEPVLLSMSSDEAQELLRRIEEKGFRGRGLYAVYEAAFVGFGEARPGLNHVPSQVGLGFDFVSDEVRLYVDEELSDLAATFTAPELLGSQR